MITRIIVLAVVYYVIFVVKVVVPLWKMMARSEEIWEIFESRFNLSPEEREEFFSPNIPQVIKCGGTKIEFSNFKEACMEFEKSIDNYLCYCQKHEWLVEPPGPEFSKMKTQLKWFLVREN